LLIGYVKVSITVGKQLWGLDTPICGHSFVARKTKNGTAGAPSEQLPEATTTSWQTQIPSPTAANWRFEDSIGWATALLPATGRRYYAVHEFS